MWYTGAVGVAWFALIAAVHAESGEVSSLQHTEQLCARYDNFTSADKRYTFATNQWGADGSGSQCMLVGDSKDAQSNSTSFAATWSWEHNPDTVHAYPNVRLNSNLLPLKLANLSSLNVDISWSYGFGTFTSSSSDLDALENAGLKANVAVDLFFDPNPNTSTSTTVPQYELMVWMGLFGGVQPVGYWGGVRAEVFINSVKFQLFTGDNSNGQRVFSWVAPENLTHFVDDISPLVRRVAFHGGPTPKDYLGVIQFGTEAFHFGDRNNVTFNAENVTMKAVKGVAPIDSAAVSTIGNCIPGLSIIVGVCVYALLASWI